MYSFFTQVPPIVTQNAKHARYATADICCLATNKGQKDERDSTPLCFGQKDRMQGGNFILDCLDFHEVRSGVSDKRDQTCWLAKRCDLFSLYCSTTA